MAHIDVTSSTFEKEVLLAPEVVLVDFWAPWCGPCRMLAPTLEAIAKLAEEDATYKGKIKVVKVNVDEEEALAQEYNISSIPDMKFFHNKTVKQQLTGARDKAAILQVIDTILESIKNEEDSTQQAA